MKIKTVSDRFCTLCGQKLSTYNERKICFSHYSARVQEILILCDSFSYDKAINFLDILRKFERIYKRSLEELADDFGISTATLSLWMNNQDLPMLRIQRKLVRFIRDKLK